MACGGILDFISVLTVQVRGGGEGGGGGGGGREATTNAHLFLIYIKCL